MISHGFQNSKHKNLDKSVHFYYYLKECMGKNRINLSKTKKMLSKKFEELEF